MMRHERDLRMKDTIVRLKNDHEEIRRQLWILRMLVSRADYELALNRALDLQVFLDSHFATEESRAREILAGPSAGYPSSSAGSPDLFGERFLEAMIGKHRSTSESFKEIQGLAGPASHSERQGCFDRFQKILIDCLEHDEEVVVPMISHAKKEYLGSSGQTKDDERPSKREAEQVYGKKVIVHVDGEQKEKQKQELVLA